MKKLLNKPWFVVVMALLALLLVGHSVWSNTRQPNYGAGAPVVSASTASAESETVAPDGVRLSVRDALKALVIPKANARDPFAQRVREVPTAVVEKLSAPDLVDTVHLSALWTQSGATYTLINEHICQAGDEIGRIKIESATQDGVWLSHWKGRDFLALGGDFTLKTPAGNKIAAIVSTL